jgi:hypothetical protein
MSSALVQVSLNQFPIIFWILIKAVHDLSMAANAISNEGMSSAGGFKN